MNNCYWLKSAFAVYLTHIYDKKYLPLVPEPQIEKKRKIRDKEFKKKFEGRKEETFLSLFSFYSVDYSII